MCAGNEFFISLILFQSCFSFIWIFFTIHLTFHLSKFNSDCVRQGQRQKWWEIVEKRNEEIAKVNKVKKRDEKFSF